jgi:hypothetical protein
MIYEATVRAIIEQAMTAPSGDNCQPWTWVWDGQVLFISHSSERGRHSINLNNSASLLSFGCLLEALEIASTSFGYKSKVTLVNPGSSDPTAAWARVEFTESVSAHGVVQAHPHYQTLEMRATDRRPYKGGSVNDPVFSEIARITKDSSKARVLVKSSDSKEFMDYALNSEYFLWTAKKVVKDLCHWMRLTSHEAASTQDGMSAQNMNINPMEASMMKLVRRYPIIPKILWHLGFKFKMKSLMKQNIQSSAALICVAVKDMSEAAIIEAGKLAMKTWLTLNKNGYGVQPLTFLSLTATNIEVGAVGAPTEGNFIKHFKIPHTFSSNKRCGIFT